MYVTNCCDCVICILCANLQILGVKLPPPLLKTVNMGAFFAFCSFCITFVLAC